jgi:hypothetical protein
MLCKTNETTARTGQPEKSGEKRVLAVRIGEAGQKSQERTAKNRTIRKGLERTLLDWRAMIGQAMTVGDDKTAMGRLSDWAKHDRLR